jgi:hypothetical protein
MRVQFNDGQEIKHDDLNRVMQLVEKSLHERVLNQLSGRQDDAFYGDSFYVDFTDATHVSVRAGLGLQLDGTQVSPESTKRLMYAATATSKAISAPDVTNPRIDIVCIKHARANTLTESRQKKDFTSGVVAPESMVTENRLEPNNHDRGWHSIGIACRTSDSIGLHQDCRTCRCRKHWHGISGKHHRQARQDARARHDFN